MPSKNHDFRKISKKSFLTTTFNHSTRYPSTSCSEKFSNDPLFLPSSPIRIPYLPEKKRRQTKNFQKGLFSHSLKRKSFGNRTEKDLFSFSINERNKISTKSSDGLINEPCGELILPINIKRKKDLEEQKNENINFFNRNINLNVEGLNINSSKESIGNNEMLIESDFMTTSWSKTFSSSKNQGIPIPNDIVVKDNMCIESSFSNINNDEINFDCDEGSIFQILSPVRIKDIPCLINIETINNLNKDKDNFVYEENRKPYVSQNNLKNSPLNNHNFGCSQLNRINHCELKSQNLTVGKNTNFWTNDERRISFICHEEAKIDIAFRDNVFSDTIEDDIVPETQFSTYSYQKSPSPVNQIQCFFEPPSQIFKDNINESEMTLRNVSIYSNRNNQKRGRPCKRLTPKFNYRWSWLHDSFTDYLNKSYSETQRQMHDMIVNPDLLKIEISLIGSFPIWGIIFFKPYKYNKEGNVAVICSTLNVPNIKMNREYLFKIYPHYNFVVYSPYEKVIINPIMNIL